ncbi:MAG: hypothetical protein SGI74_07350 [Oligoflexia bacterium]|nr:hypothetical protein [Oligoflexia bacterium]
MAVVSDNEIDRDIGKMKTFAAVLKKTLTIFSNNFKTLPPKERAQTIRHIQADQKTLLAFIEKSKTFEIHNAGTKFGLENLKQSLQTILTVWKKIEKNLENYGTAGGTVTSKNIDEADIAIESYAAVLKGLGHQATKEHLHEFKEKLSAAYKTAQEKSGGKELSIKIVQVDGKIKVRMEPK